MFAEYPANRVCWAYQCRYLERLKDVFAAKSKEEAMRRKKELVIQLEENHADVAE